MTIQEKIKQHIDDPNGLSKILLEVIAEYQFVGNVLSTNQLAHSEAKLSALTSESEKKISVAQAEIMADVKTKHTHDKTRYHRDALLELINGIKARLRVLETESNLNPNP